ncbi:tyrosine-type recombinase/integrase [Candidatus Bipolaricaulota bacterium]
MEHVEPIRDEQKITEIKEILRRRSSRDYLLFVFGLHSRSRVTSFLHLSLRDICTEDGEPRNPIIFFEKKTGEKKKVWLNDELEDAIRFRLQEISHFDGTYPVFRSQKGSQGSHPIGRLQALRLIKEWCKEVELPGKYGTETYRKTWAYRHWRQMKDLSLIQMEFRHTSLIQTANFIGLSKFDIDSTFRAKASNIDTSVLGENAAEAIRLIAQIDEARRLDEQAIRAVGPAIFSPYREVMKLVFLMYCASPDWELNRQRLQENSGNMCTCEKRFEVAHHTVYGNWANGMKEVDDLEPMCSGCHGKLHSSSKAPDVPFWARRDASMLSASQEYLRDLARVLRSG